MLLHHFVKKTIVVTSCFLSWRKKPDPKGVYHIRKEFALRVRGANSFLKEFALIKKGVKEETDRVESPGGVSIHLKLTNFFYGILS